MFEISIKSIWTTEVFVLQEQMSALQVKLDEEERKNLKLQQHIDKLEHHSTQMQEVRPRGRPRNVWNRFHTCNTLQRERKLQEENDLVKPQLGLL